jgi:antitoxin component of MazEF toxin-antitoxin module
VNTTSKIRAVGNSRGVILPKKYLDQCGIEDVVNIAIQDNMITIAAAKNVKKKKWADFKPSTGKEKVAFISNKFDETEWTW